MVGGMFEGASIRGKKGRLLILLRIAMSDLPSPVCCMARIYVHYFKDPGDYDNLTL